LTCDLFDIRPCFVATFTGIKLHKLVNFRTSSIPKELAQPATPTA